MNVKLINLNIWHGGWRLWDNILAYLKAEQPDIVMLQEVFMSGESNVAPYLKTVESLKNEIGLLHDAQAAEFILHTGRETAPMGNAIMSRFPLKNRNIHWVHGSGSLLELGPCNGWKRSHRQGGIAVAPQVFEVLLLCPGTFEVTRSHPGCCECH
jgi:exonuclease III